MQTYRRRVGYVLASRQDPRLAAAIAAGTSPRPEYYVFRQRNDTPYISYEDVERSALPLARISRLVRRANWGLAAVALAAQGNFDGLLATGEDVGLPLAIGARLRRIERPIYVITHGSYFASPKLRLLMTVLQGMANVYYLCLSGTLRDTLLETYRLPASQVHNTSYGVDTAFFQPMEAQSVGAATPRPIVASAGTANRDYRSLVMAATSLDAEVKIAADSAWFPASIDITANRLPPNVEARSYGNYQGLRELYARARFVVVPLYPARHACGYAVVAEAMAMGKAVIATWTEAYNDFIVDGVTGYYVKAGDVDDLRAKMGRLLDNLQEAVQMGQRARARAMEHFSVEAYCRRIEEVLQGRPVDHSRSSA